MNRIGAFAVCILTILTSCFPDYPYYRENGSVYGKEYTIYYQSQASFFREIEAIVEQSNHSLNVYNPVSIISRVNRNEAVVLDTFFIDVFNKSIALSEMTHGLFDPTCFPLVSFWRNAFAEPDKIPEYQVDSIKQFVGYRKIRIENDQVIKDDPRIQLTLTALAKGYTCDRIVALLENKGIHNYMVDMGGVIVAKGIDQQGNAWQSAIRKPVETDDNRTIGIEQVVQIPDRHAMGTSGDFKNYYIRNGKKYAHTINPITGYPAEQDVLSSTIIAHDGITADGLSTAFTALSSEQLRQLGDSLPDIEYFIIHTDSNGEYVITYSEGMKKHLLKQDKFQ